MKIKHWGILASIVSLALIFSDGTSAAIKTEPIEYKDGDTTLQGYLAVDDAIPGKRPGVLIFHEWKGVGEYTKKRAEQLAALGYAAFAADMYGKGVYAKDHEEAGKLVGAFRENRDLTRQRAKAALEVLQSRPEVDADKIAAIGYCFGGMTVLEMARAGFDLDGVASFHGSLGTPEPAKPGAIKAKVLVLHGAEDAHTSADLPAFMDEMKNAGADWQVIAYGGAVHSFTVPEAGNDKSKGAAYDEKADRRSWKALLDFFGEIF